MGEGVERVLWRVRGKVESWGLLVPLLAEGFGGTKMIYVSDPRATNFSLHGEKHFAPKHVKFGIFCLLSLTVGKESCLQGPCLKFNPENFKGEWCLFLGFMHPFLIMLLTCYFLWVLSVHVLGRNFPCQSYYSMRMSLNHSLSPIHRKFSFHFWFKKCMSHKKHFVLAQKCEKSFWQVDFWLRYLRWTIVPSFPPSLNNHFLKFCAFPCTPVEAIEDITKPEWAGRCRKVFLEEWVPKMNGSWLVVLLDGGWGIVIPGWWSKTGKLHRDMREYDEFQELQTGRNIHTQRRIHLCVCMFPLN